MRATGLLLMLGLWSGVAAAAARTGTVALSLDGKPLRAEEARDAVVYFRADQPPPLQPAADALLMRMERKQFQPRALPVVQGSRVRFDNFDPILHNAFSPAGPNGFDLGLYGEGEAREHRFDRAGLVRVYCNVHHDMVAHVLVLDTPYFTRPDASGRFRLDIPDGVSGELFVWHERSRLWRQRSDEAGEPFRIGLELSRPRVPPHMNKFGKPYGSRRSGY